MGRILCVVRKSEAKSKYTPTGTAQIEKKSKQQIRIQKNGERRSERGRGESGKREGKESLTYLTKEVLTMMIITRTK